MSFCAGRGGVILPGVMGGVAGKVGWDGMILCNGWGLRDHGGCWGGSRGLGWVGTIVEGFV